MFGWLSRSVLKVNVLTASETGAVRKDNQDTVFVDGAKTVFCVADGMGGGSEGATASRFVCEEIEKAVAAKTLAERMAAAAAAIVAANDRIRAYAKERGFKQMGSTAAVLLVDPSDSRRTAICHVGDSRIYRIRRRKAELLTHDHTIGGQLGDMTKGILSAGFKSRSNPLAHVLTRAIGGADRVEGDWKKIDVSDGDRFLICSDGVHDVVSDARIGVVLSCPGGLKESSRRLTDEVVRHGAPDNFSYVMVEFGGGR